jgi:capsular polysaccharide biosynthesis protein
MIILCYSAFADAPQITVVSLKKLKKIEPSIHYSIIHKPIKLQFKRFPLASSKSSTWEAPILPQTFILHVPKGRIFSDGGYVLVKERYVVSELLWPWSPYKKGKKALSLKNAGPLQPISGKVVVLTQEGHRNYYHWMLEILPKLALLKDVEPYDWICMPRMNLPFQKQTLAMMGVDLNKVIEVDPTTYLEADEIIVPSFVSRSCYTPHWVVEYLRKHLMLGERSDLPNKFGDKIFISRQKASYRRITNEDEIFAYLETLGFKRYHLEDLSIEDQRILFSNAKIIIGPHGAGLTNLIFCQPGTKVLEIFQSHEDDTYCYLAQVVGLDYHCLKTTQFVKGGGYTDTSISLSLFQDFVKAVVKL